MILRCCITCWTSGWLKAQPKNWSLFLFHISVRWSPMGTRRGRWLLRLVRHLPGKRPLPTRRNKKDNWVVWLEKKASAFFLCRDIFFSDSNKGLGKTERPGHTRHWSIDGFLQAGCGTKWKVFGHVARVTLVCVTESKVLGCLQCLAGTPFFDLLCDVLFFSSLSLSVWWATPLGSFPALLEVISLAVSLTGVESHFNPRWAALETGYSATPIFG